MGNLGNRDFVRRQRRKESQASDVGSIPIARSITPDDSIAFLPGSC